MPISSPANSLRQTGFSYVGVLFLIAIIAVAASAGVQVGAIANRRDAELELLEIGKEYRNALLTYSAVSPPGQARRPRSLQDLLRDPRFPYLKRHLRAVYADPMTGTENWVTVMSDDGSGIIGFHSTSDRRPIKIGNFPPEIEHFAGKTSYRDWVFSLPN